MIVDVFSLKNSLKMHLFGYVKSKSGNDEDRADKTQTKDGNERWARDSSFGRLFSLIIRLFLVLATLARSLACCIWCMCTKNLEGTKTV